MTPAVRITFAILSLTISLILMADFLGMTPNAEDGIIQQRQHFTEMLAVQLTVAAEQKNSTAFKSLLLTAVKRNPEIISAGFRRKGGELLVTFGDHGDLWQGMGQHNNSESMQLPIIVNQRSYGAVELLFKPLGEQGLWGLQIGTLTTLLLFVAIIGGLFYWLLIRRSLMYLDPNAVIPERVRAALDVLTNGVVIIDYAERVVLCNQRFSEFADVSVTALTGKKVSSLHWVDPKTGQAIAKDQLPWSQSQGEKSVHNKVVSLQTESDLYVILRVNCSQIGDDSSQRLGSMISFDDITELEHKNNRLKNLVNELSFSKEQVEQQNTELHYLANHDSLTGCFNRRAFFQLFNAAREQSKKKQNTLACIMTDIDFFKRVNDTYGHAAGDEVIKFVVSSLNHGMRDTDQIGRYGGEEFCIMLPNTSAAEAAAVAERCRQIIDDGDSQGLKVTCSFGVSSTYCGAMTPEALINIADQALYRAKNSGRNCVKESVAPALSSQ
ncbi:hypothetical protein SIN8267_00626 [Sinobacterium norvegicum]|uniref:diguanylate cyclase n=1 Tax=Sinobacterium norvegicum TaxID=1641715 RepID=A0ABN8EHG5_9GAMM|nr:hypothetical protein SIN8267_00626 [Sinobacterium norvegicum]